MFYYLKGILAHTEPNLAVVDVGGVGYACTTTLNTLSRITLNQPVKLYTYVHVREDIFDIFGFYDPQEMSCFKQLLSVSGVGPKAAISILSAASAEAVALSIITEDDSMLTAAQGIGKKLAQRIILELKDKIGKAQIDAPQGMQYTAPAGSNKAAEACAALAVLGYSQAQAAAALKDVEVDQPVEQIVKQALKKLVKM